MTRLWPEGDAITIRLDSHGLPSAFTWQGRTHTIRQVHQHWQVDGEWWSEEGQVRREYLAVTTGDGLLCVLYHNHLDRAWYVAKVYD